jgi:hypothetical protein
LVAFNLPQPGNTVALQAAVKRRPGQLRDRCLQGTDAVVERKESMPAQGNDNGFLSKRKNGGLW